MTSHADDILAWARVHELKAATLDRATSLSAWLQPDAALGRALAGLVARDQFTPPLSVSAIGDADGDRAFSFSWSPVGGPKLVMMAPAVRLRLPLHVLVLDAGRKHKSFTIPASRDTA